MAKKSFVLRIDESLYMSLEKWASDEFRSVNGQIEWMLHQKLTENGRLRKAAPDQENTKPEKKKPSE